MAETTLPPRHQEKQKSYLSLKIKRLPWCLCALVVKDFSFTGVSKSPEA
jgi:hypothetical protein